MTSELRINQDIVDSLLQLPLSGFGKGTPLGMAGTVRDLLGMNIRAFPTPIMLLSAPALSHNLATMAAFCQRHGVWLAPHAKTTMAPSVLARQVEAGAWAITAATLAQVAVLRRFGVNRILLANEPMDPEGLEWLAQELSRHPDFEFFCLIDSPTGISRLRQMPTERVGIFVEFGHDSGRTGVRSTDAARHLFETARSSNQRVVGLETYEGLLVREDEPNQSRVRAHLREFAALAEVMLVDAEPGQLLLVSAGGSAAFDHVAELLSDLPGTQLVLRSGCYATHDAGWYENVSPFGIRGVEGHSLHNAIEIHATIISRPEANLAIADAGKRDLGFDLGLPSVLGRLESDGTQSAVSPTPVVAMLSDQHTHLTNARGLKIGDRVALGVSHPCSTFDRWRIIPILDDSGVVTDVAITFF